MVYCCDKFRKTVEEPETAIGRKTTFWKDNTGKWNTDFSDGEYGDIELTFCPFCGKRLEVNKQ